MRKNQKVTYEQVHHAYRIAKNIYDNPSKSSKKHGADTLHFDYGVNHGTASDFINIFHSLLNGTVFKRALSVYAMEYFLTSIYRDYGQSKLDSSLAALMQHIIYREEGNTSTGRKPVKQKAMRIIYDNFSSQKQTYATLTNDEIEQEELFKNLIKINLSKKDIEQEITRLNNHTPTKITSNLSSYKRENRAITLIKLLRKPECQICGIGIPKEDGSFYVEAAHIKPKHQGGNETLENIILLCPNHHKEFDLNKQVIKHNGNSVDITLNGKTYNILLT